MRCMRNFAMAALFSAAAALGQNKTSALTGVNWVPVTGNGAPTLTCNSTFYGLPYTDLTNQVVYACASGGWFKTSLTGTVTFTGAWSSTTTYAVNQAVFYSGSTYVSVQAPNLNQNPATATAYWVLFASGGGGGATTPATSNLLKGNGSANGVVAATPGTDYVVPSGNVATATALAATPAQCSGSQFAQGVAANGNANCGTPSGANAGVAPQGAMYSTTGSTVSGTGTYFAPASTGAATLVSVAPNTSGVTTTAQGYGIASPTHVYVRTWRQRGSNTNLFDNICSTEDLLTHSPVAGVNTIAFSNPCAVVGGDYVSLYVTASGSANETLLAGNPYRIRTTGSLTAIQIKYYTSGLPFDSYSDSYANSYVDSSPVANGTSSHAFATANVSGNASLPAILNLYENQYPILAVVGDSELDGFNTLNDATSMTDYWEKSAGQTAPTNLNTVLVNQMPTYIANALGWTLANYAEAGTTSSIILNRLTASVIPIHPKLIILPLSLNDVKAGSYNFATSTANYTAMLAAAAGASPAIPVVMLSAGTWSTANATQSGQLDQLNTLSSLCIAPACTWVDYRPYINEFQAGAYVGNLWNIQPQLYFSDGIHINPIGQQIIASRILATLNGPNFFSAPTLEGANITAPVTLTGAKDMSFVQGQNPNETVQSGHNTTWQAGGSAPGQTNINGGTLSLNGGTSTGSGYSSVAIGCSFGGASGTQDSPPQSCGHFIYGGYYTGTLTPPNPGAISAYANKIIAESTAASSQYGQIQAICLVANCDASVFYGSNCLAVGSNPSCTAVDSWLTGTRTAGAAAGHFEYYNVAVGDVFDIYVNPSNPGGPIGLTLGPGTTGANLLNPTYPTGGLSMQSTRTPFHTFNNGSLSYGIGMDATAAEDVWQGDITGGYLRFCIGTLVSTVFTPCATEQGNFAHDTGIFTADFGISTKKLVQTASNSFAGTCAMASSTTCSVTISSVYASAPLCWVTAQGTSILGGATACSVGTGYGTTGWSVTVTAAVANSNTFAVMLIGNPN